MKKSLPTLLITTLLSTASQAALYDRCNGLIYDDVLDVTWLQDANYAQTSGADADGLMTWTEARDWAANLEYGGFDDWRLSSAGDDPILGFNAPSLGIDPRSELGHMFYNNLGNLPGTPITTNVSFVDAASGDLTSFLNVQPFAYWTGDDNPVIPSLKWTFFTNLGRLGYWGEENGLPAWAVRDGDVAAAVTAVPVPGALWLFGSALLGLIGLRRQKA